MFFSSVWKAQWHWKALRICINQKRVKLNWSRKSPKTLSDPRLELVLSNWARCPPSSHLITYNVIHKVISQIWTTKPAAEMLSPPPAVWTAWEQIQKDLSKSTLIHKYLRADKNRGDADLYAEVIFGPAGEWSCVDERNSCCSVSSACRKTVVHDQVTFLRSHLFTNVYSRKVYSWCLKPLNRHKHGDAQWGWLWQQRLQCSSKASLAWWELPGRQGCAGGS